MARARGFHFVVNNYSLDDIEQVSTLDAQYLVVGAEVGGDKGTPHLQCYAYFKLRKSFRALSKLVPRAHWIIAKGTAKQNRIYCSKEGDWYERGTMPKQGQRKDLDEIRQLALTEGMGAVSATGNQQQIRVAEKFLTYNEEPRDEAPKVYWFYGETGTGKSRTAHEMFPEAYVKPPCTKWWEGYDGHEEVIIDDYRAGMFKISELLALTDRYEHRVECKGGYRQLKANTIVFTAPFHPRLMMPWNGADSYDQFERRLHEIKDFGQQTGQKSKGNSIPSPLPDDIMDDIFEELLPKWDH